MAEKFRFFDPVQLEDGTYDREYNAQEFTDYFRAIILTGVLRAAGDGLVISSNGNNMQSTISTGIAFLEGRYYENDSPLLLTHDTEVLGNSRIDRIVIRLDKNPDKRYVKAFIKKGTPSANPVAPILTQNATVYEISLAQVLIIGGQTFIATNAVIDEREYAGSNIIPSFDDNALAQLTNQFDAHNNNLGIHVTPADKGNWNAMLRAITVGGSGEDANEPIASTILTNGTSRGAPDNGYWFITTFRYQPGSGSDNLGQIAVAYLNNGSRGSDMRTRYRFGGVWSAWSPSIQELFTSVSNGKTLVANAITQMGVPTAVNAEFATMESNIRKLRGYATGTRTVSQDGSLSVTGLTFEPKVVIAVIGSGVTAGHMYIEKLSTASGYIVEAFDASNTANQPPAQFSPVWGKRKTDSNVLFTATSFSIPIKSAATYTWYAYG